MHFKVDCKFSCVKLMIYHFLYTYLNPVSVPLCDDIDADYQYFLYLKHCL